MNDRMVRGIARGRKAISALCLGVGFVWLFTACDKNRSTEPVQTSLPARQFISEVPLAWFTLQLNLVKESSGFSPPVASRVFGYSGVALYEAVVPGIETHRNLAGQLNGLTPLPPLESGREYHWPTVGHSALASITKRFFANATRANKAAIDSLEAILAAKLHRSVRADVFKRSVARGRVVADAIAMWSLRDAGHDGGVRDFPAQYPLPLGTGLWRPTPPGFLRALQPSWGGNRPFVLSSGRDCPPGPPPTYSEQPGTPFYREAVEVYETGKHLTREQRVVAEFWADTPGETSTPPGHWISILNQILDQRNATLDVAAEAYAKVGIAVADAFIACWYVKYEYNLLRPITYIANVLDPTWTSLIATPQFPEYPSGHSVQSAAAAQVLTDMFGNVAFTDHSHDSRNLAPRSFTSFVEAAEEAAVSRLYGGIHFRSAIAKGLEQGKCIGEKVTALRFRR